MSIKKVRNEHFEPFIDREGFFNGTGLAKPPSIDEDEKKLWYENLEPHVRLYHHNTLSSTRRHANFYNIRKVLNNLLIGFVTFKMLNLIRSPKDSLDVVLSSEYNQTDNLFYRKQEVYKQPETNDKSTFRRLRNTKDFYIEPPVYLSHPLKTGGLSERPSVYSVKLINSGPHSQITNHGFSRQSVDGNFFNY